MHFVLVFYCNGELAEIQQRLRQVECTRCEKRSLTCKLEGSGPPRWSLVLTDLTERGRIDGHTLAEIIAALAATGRADIISFGRVPG